MTGPEHYREAEALLAQGYTDDAQVHALLAVAAAVNRRFGEPTVKWCGVCDSPGHTSDEHPKPRQP